MDHDSRISDPPCYYKHPSSILADPTLSNEERIIALKNWLDDIYLKMIATEENMRGNSEDLTLVAEINNLLSYLEQSH